MARVDGIWMVLMAGALVACGSPPPPAPDLPAQEPSPSGMAHPPLSLDRDHLEMPAVKDIDESAALEWRLSWVPHEEPFAAPEGLDRSSDGSWAVAEPVALRVRLRRPDGTWRVLATGGPGRQDGAPGISRWMGPRAIRWSPAGKWLVADFDHLRWLSMEGTSETWSLRRPDGRPYLPVEILGLTPLESGAWAITTPSGVDRVEASGLVRPLAGQETTGFRDGPGGQALFRLPRQPTTLDGGRILVPDQGNLVLREIAPDGRVTTWAGSGLPGLVDDWRLRARFGYPLAVDRAADGRVAIADTYNHAIRVIELDGRVRTLLDEGLPTQVRWDPAGRLWLLDGREGRLGWLEPFRGGARG